MKPHRQTPTALVTGASSGLGAEFATQLAERGHNLVLVARSADRLQRHAEQLRAAHGVEVTVIVQDLTAPDAVARINSDLTAAGLTVDLLVNNAGFGTAGRFEEIPDGRDQDQLMVNVVALVGLTRALIPGMLARGQGGVINVGSTAGFQPSPYFATYSAGKTFVLNFSLALRSEYHDRGVRVLALCPGPTQTSFFDTVGEQAALGGKLMPAATVVHAALRGLDRGRAYVVPGLGNALNAHLTPRRPRRLVTAISKLITRSVLRTAPQPPQQAA
jgi:short-subunit dehydrogenase